MDIEYWLKRAQNTIENELTPGKKFELKNLFPGHEWEALSVGDRRSFGRDFASLVRDGFFPTITLCEQGKTRHNQYIKKR